VFSPAGDMVAKHRKVWTTNIMTDVVVV
jgi:hypothetical protein